ncbi:MAG: dihydrolipoamide acetyltransferase family protein [Candidatus Fimivivens sp.]|nr:dihydrolipoamide acetyltransferase family protein [Candidatus Fimivivens sp.]
MSFQIVMPKAGLTMVEGTISEWKVVEGASVNKGDVLMEYENEKNTIECVALSSGILHIIAKEGDTIAVGEPIGELAESQAEYAAMTGAVPAVTPVVSAPAVTIVSHAVPIVSTAAASETGAAVRADGRVRATGLAKKMAREAGVNIADILPSGGPDGARIVAKDVAAYLEAKKSAPVPAINPIAAPVSTVEDEITEIPWTGVRKAIARNLFNSLQQSAQCTATSEMDVTALLALRQKLVDQQEFLGCKITVNDLLCMAVAKMLAKHPLANATFDGKTLFSHKHVNLSVAIATEEGLMVPVVKCADTLSLVALSKAIKDLGTRAKEKKLRDGEQSGGTFTVSNVGMFPIDMSTPIINLPEVAIMGFGRTTKKPIYIDGAFVPRDMLCCYLTFDHRVVDGLEVGRIFKDMQQLIEHPELITV